MKKGSPRSAVQILGQPVYHSLAAIPGLVDVVNVFRRPHDIPSHLDDILAKRPRAVWFRSGIRHDEAAERLARAGIRVVQDCCLLVEHPAANPSGAPLPGWQARAPR